MTWGTCGQCRVFPALRWLHSSMLGHGVSIDSAQQSHGSTKMGENNRFSFAKTSFGTLYSDLNELSGLSVGETYVSVFVGSALGSVGEPFCH